MICAKSVVILVNNLNILLQLEKIFIILQSKISKTGMKKFISLVICALCFGISVNSNAQSVGSGLNCFIANQKNTKGLNEAFSQRVNIEKIQDKEYISLLMRVNKESDLSFLKKYDCILCQRVGRIVTVKVNVNEIAKFVKEKEIIEVDAARTIHGENLRYATKDFNAQSVWEGIDLSQSYTGKDVLIGVADWGIDFTHPTFYDSIGENYRILAAWDHNRRQGPAPEGFDYGTLIEGEVNLIAAQGDTANQYDIGYHSTHVGGIAAGSGYTTKYKGVAYDANLIFCTWICDELHYIDCCVWMKNYAKSLNKRLVINNSWGVYNFGYMDGSSMIDEFINTMSDEDSVIFVVSAGNNGGSDFHLKADFTNNESDTVRSEIEFNFPTPYTNDYWGQAITLQSENNAMFSSKLEFYNYKWEKIGETPLLVSNGSSVPEDILLGEDGDSIIYRGSSRYPEDNRPLVDWEVRQSKYINNIFHIVLMVTDCDGIVHAWNLNKLSKAVGNTGFKFEATQEGFLAGDSEYGVSEPALAQKTIAVAAHKFKLSEWQPIIAEFSSRGTNMTSYYKPEISAPGYSIVSSVSSHSSSSPTAKEKVTFNGKEYGFGSASGTSMSGPMVAGSVALILQANPTLTSDEVKEIITQNAKTDSYTGECPNDVWGFGKLNTYAAVKAAEKKLGFITTKDNLINIFPIPAKDILYIEGLDKDNEISITDINGRTLIKEKLNGEVLNISCLKSGVYILNINTKDGEEKIKFIKK